MTLTRADLECDRLRTLFTKANPHAPVLSDEELETSLQKLLATHRLCAYPLISKPPKEFPSTPQLDKRSIIS